MKKILTNNIKLILILLSTYIIAQDKVDIVIYSMNRPMQVYALLESIYENVLNTGNIYILYRTSDNSFEQGYQEVKKTFPKVYFVKQDHGLNGSDFKPLNLQCAFESPHDYVSFVVDDCIVKEPVDLADCIAALKKVDNSFAFFLRLGRNITECYSLKINTPPPCNKYSNNIYIWQFKTGMKDTSGWDALTLGDWNFATTVDFCIFRKSEIRQFFETHDYLNLSYEGQWWEEFKNNPQNMEKYGICFEKSKIVNVCVNIANDLSANLNQFSQDWQKKMLQFSTTNLLKKFIEGFKIDIKDIYKINNSAPHVEYEYRFIQRVHV